MANVSAENGHFKVECFDCDFDILIAALKATPGSSYKADMESNPVLLEATAANAVALWATGFTLSGMSLSSLMIDTLAPAAQKSLLRHD